MIFCSDIDGTIDAAPPEFQAILGALVTCGNRVVMLTGWDDDTVPADAWDLKHEHLQKLGFNQDVHWTDLVLVPRPHDENKADYMESIGAKVLFENDKQNATAATAVAPLVLVCWATRV